MAKNTPQDDDFRKEISAKLQAHLRTTGIRACEAAMQLGVTKQAFSLYMNRRATPGGEVLAKLCALWGLSFNYRGKQISAKDFPKAEAAPKVVPQQLHFVLEELVELREADNSSPRPRDGANAVLSELRVSFKVAS